MVKEGHWAVSDWSRRQFIRRVAEATGAERTTAWPQVQAAAKKNGLEIEEDQRAHLGIFYRSDHFSMARAGVPAFSVAPGMKIQGKPKDFASKAYKEFNDNVYHSPQDEFRSDWDFAGFVGFVAVGSDRRRPTFRRGQGRGGGAANSAARGQGALRRALDTRHLHGRPVMADRGGFRGRN